MKQSGRVSSFQGCLPVSYDFKQKMKFQRKQPPFASLHLFFSLQSFRREIILNGNFIKAELHETGMCCQSYSFSSLFFSTCYFLFITLCCPTFLIYDNLVALFYIYTHVYYLCSPRKKTVILTFISFVWPRSQLFFFSFHRIQHNVIKISAVFRIFAAKF